MLNTKSILLLIFLALGVNLTSSFAATTHEFFSKELDSWIYSNGRIKFDLSIEYQVQEKLEKRGFDFCGKLHRYDDQCVIETKRMNELLAMLQERAKEINRMILLD